MTPPPRPPAPPPPRPPRTHHQQPCLHLPGEVGEQVNELAGLGAHQQVALELAVELKLLVTQVIQGSLGLGGADEGGGQSGGQRRTVKREGGEQEAVWGGRGAGGQPQDRGRGGRMG